MQSKMAIKICEGISCSSFYVKDCDVIIHKKSFFLVKPYQIFGQITRKPGGWDGN